MPQLGVVSDRIARLLAFGAYVGVVVMMLHVCADVALRSAFSIAVPATVEIVSRYYMVLVAFLPLAWVERRHGMIALELFDRFLPDIARRLSDALVALFATAVYGVMAYTTWLVAMDNFASGTFVLALNTEVPVWPSYFLPPAGLALAALATLLRAGLRAAGRDADRPET